MKKPLFSGVCTALVTPFHDNKINYHMLSKLLERQLCNNINTIVLAGTTGESPTLSDREKIELFRYAKEFVGDNCTIIAGTGSNDTAHAAVLSKAAENIGVDALLVVTPYYNKANKSGLYAHYEQIANSVSIPIIVYNVPSRTCVDIPIDVYKQLSQIPNIAGTKEASTDITKQAKIHASCGSDLAVWAGNDDQIVPSIVLGGCGVISVLSNIFPAETNRMVQAALHGNYQEATELQISLSEIISLLFADINPIPVKYAMQHIGYDCGNCRLPLCAPTSDLKEKIASYFSKKMHH